MTGLSRIAIAAWALLLGACSSMPQPPLATVTGIDLPSYMGDWYVIAHIPPWIEQDTYGSVESYRLDPDGTVGISFAYRKGSASADVRRLTSRGFIVNGPQNTIWDVQFVWPLRSDYRITYIAPDYSQTIVSRDKRDYVWIMARSPVISEADYTRLLRLVADQGYDVAQMRRVPQEPQR